MEADVFSLKYRNVRWAIWPFSIASLLSRIWGFEAGPSIHSSHTKNHILYVGVYFIETGSIYMHGKHHNVIGRIMYLVKILRICNYQVARDWARNRYDISDNVSHPWEQVESQTDLWQCLLSSPMLRNEISNGRLSLYWMLSNSILHLHMLLHCHYIIPAAYLAYAFCIYSIAMMRIIGV